MSGGVQMLTALRLSLVAVVAGFGLLTLACGDGGSTLSGEVRFVRDVDLPDDATVTVQLLDTRSPTPRRLNLARRDRERRSTACPIQDRVRPRPGRGAQTNTRSRRGSKLGDELLYINDNRPSSPHWRRAEEQRCGGHLDRSIRPVRRAVARRNSFELCRCGIA